MLLKKEGVLIKVICFLLIIIFSAGCDRNALSDYSEENNDENAMNDKNELSDTYEEKDDTIEESDNNSVYDDEPDTAIEDSDLIDEIPESDDFENDEDGFDGVCQENDQCGKDEICYENICEDPYSVPWSVTIVSVTLNPKNPDGEEWDPGVIGIGAGLPDPYVQFMKNGIIAIETSKGDETYSVTFNVTVSNIIFSETDSISFKVFDYDSTLGDDDDPAGEFADSWNGSQPGPVTRESLHIGEMIFSGSGTAELIIRMDVE
jgi:hypothetical protein